MRVNDRWYRNKTASTILNYAANTLFGLDTVINIIGSYPVLKFITTPIDGCLKIISYGLWQAAILFDPKIDQEGDPNKRKFLRASSWFDKFSAGFGCLSGVAVLISVCVPVIAPIALFIAASCLLVSNACMAGGQIAELIRVIKHEPDNGSRGPTIAAQAARVIYSSFGTLSIACLVASLVVAVVFPPAGAALLAASMVTAVIGGAGFVSALIFDKVVSDRTKTIESRQKSEPTAEVHHDITVENNIRLAPKQALINNSSITPCSTDKASKQQSADAEQLVETTVELHKKPVEAEEQRRMRQRRILGIPDGIPMENYARIAEEAAKIGQEKMGSLSVNQETARQQALVEKATARRSSYTPLANCPQLTHEEHANTPKLGPKMPP